MKGSYVALAVGLICFGTAQAVKADTVAVGYAWGSQTTGRYTPFGTYAYNSSGGAIDIVQTGNGKYRVTFFGLGVGAIGGGNAQASAYGGAAEYCNVRDWATGGGNVTVNINCYNPDGTPANTQYTVLFQRLPGTSSVAYLWNNLMSETGTPDHFYQLNQDISGFAGENALSVHTGTGTYTVRIAGNINGNSGASGSVAITAQGTTTNHCKVVSWSARGFLTDINVKCHDGAGRNSDSYFSLAYGPNFKGATPNPGKRYGLAHDPTSASYSLQPRFSGGSIIVGSNTTAETAFRHGTGLYSMTFEGMQADPGAPTSLQVSAYGDSSDYCKLNGWGNNSGTSTVAFFKCFTVFGSPVDTMYDANWITRQPGK